MMQDQDQISGEGKNGAGSPDNVMQSPNGASPPQQHDHSSDGGDAKSEQVQVQTQVQTQEEAEAKFAELNDAYLRAKAEVENIRRRSQQEIARAHKYAIEGFAESLIPVKDSLEAALTVDAPSVESIKEGVEMTLKQLTAAFERNDLKEINPSPGDKLDPMKHQAISMVPMEQSANTIISVLQKGYTIADRLLRPALVTVAQEISDQNRA